MKPITILLAFLLAGTINSYSQESSGLDYNDLAAKLEKSNKALDNPKKNSDVKFWLERAKLFQDIAEVNTQFLRLNLSTKELVLFSKQPKQIKKDSANKEQYIYDRYIAYFKNGKLTGWKETQTIVPNPLEDALAAYKKAIELDADKKNEKKISEGLKSLKNLYSKKALNCYGLEDLTCSFESFKTIVDINEMKQVNVVDTGIMYNAGLTAVRAGKNDEAIKYLQKVADLKYTGDPFLFTNLKKAYLAKGDTVSALNTLKQGVSVFPNDISIIIELINYYISAGEKQAALEYLTKAKQSDPKNRSFYYAEGALYDKMGGAIDNKLLDLEIAKKAELTQLDENKKAEFKKTGNNVQKYKPIDDKYQKLRKLVEDKYKSREDSLSVLHEDFQNKAIGQYKEAVKVDPTYFDAYYNLGVLFFNNGVKLSDQAGREVDDKKYEAKKNASDEEFKKAVPVMESAYEVNEKAKVTPETAAEIAKNRKTTLDVLKTLYYRLKMNDQFDRIKKLQDAAPAGQSAQ
jgi:tetratricopeptide (TPR) repeat protein